MSKDPKGTQAINPKSLAESAQAHSQKGLPPVHLWNPDFCGDIDIHIKRDGSWDYMGTPISRERMVRLFSTILRRDADDAYYLVTPVEKVRIKVDDVPFIISGCQTVEEKGKPQQLLMETNMGDRLIVNTDHPIRVETTASGEPAPYVLVRGRLEARLHRNVFYQLVDIAEEKEIDGKKLLGVMSAGEFFPLGEVGE